MALRRVTAVVVAIAGAALVGCNEDVECNSPTIVAVHSGDGQSGPTCGALDQPLTVRVQCSNNQPTTVATVVEWQVDAGGGSVDPPTSETDATGRASTRLTLGPAPGQNVVRATAAGLPAATFVAEAVEPCSFSRPLALGIRAGGALDSCDCQLSDGSYIEFLRLNVGPQQQTIQFDMVSREFDPFLVLLDGGGFIAGNDDKGDGVNARIRIIMRPGAYRVGANSWIGRVHGAYELVTASVSSDVVGCEPIWATPGIWTGQELTQDSCFSEGFYLDSFLIVLRTGQTVTVTMSSTQFDPIACIARLGTEEGACDDDGGTGTDARVVYTCPADGVYGVLAATYWAGGFGKYTLNVSAPSFELETAVGEQMSRGKGVRVTAAGVRTASAVVLANARKPKALHRLTQVPLEP